MILAAVVAVAAVRLVDGEAAGLVGYTCDRMLVAQALAEGIKFVSHDDKIAKYGDVVVAV